MGKRKRRLFDTNASTLGDESDEAAGSPIATAKTAEALLASSGDEEEEDDDDEQEEIVRSRKKPRMSTGLDDE